MDTDNGVVKAWWAGAGREIKGGGIEGHLQYCNNKNNFKNLLRKSGTIIWTLKVR